MDTLNFKHIKSKIVNVLKNEYIKNLLIVVLILLLPLINIIQIVYFKSNFTILYKLIYLFVISYAISSNVKVALFTTISIGVGLVVLISILGYMLNKYIPENFTKVEKINYIADKGSELLLEYKLFDKDSIDLFKKKFIEYNKKFYNNNDNNLVVLNNTNNIKNMLKNNDLVDDDVTDNNAYLDKVYNEKMTELNQMNELNDLNDLSKFNDLSKYNELVNENCELKSSNKENIEGYEKNDEIYSSF
jgi:hypothetical protein